MKGIAIGVLIGVAGTWAFHKFVMPLPGTGNAGA